MAPERIPTETPAPAIRRATGDYEVDRQAHMEALGQIAFGAIDTVTWPIERLHAVRDRRLRAVLRTARERSPWHARRLRDVDVETITGDDLSAIPTMTKEDLMAHWDEIVIDRRLTLDLATRHLAHLTEHGPAYLLDEYHVVATGGSTGVFVWDWDGWLQAATNTMRHVFWLIRNRARPVVGDVRVASLFAEHAIHMSESMRRTFEPADRGLALPVTMALRDMVAGLNEYQPTSIVGYPSVLHQLAHEALAGRLRIDPIVVTGGSEPFTEEAQATCRQAWDALVLNPYGTSENWLIGVSYPGTEGIHLVEDVAVYEPVDPANRPVPVGRTAAKVLITNVINHVMPLLRYELTDEVTFLDEPNPDPWPGRRIANVQGRTDDLFTYPGNVAVHPYVFWSALGRDPLITEYQVRQTARGADISVRLAGEVSLPKARKKIIAGLDRLGLPDAQVTITAVDSIPRQANSGKLRRFVPLA